MLSLIQGRAGTLRRNASLASLLTFAATAELASAVPASSNPKDAKQRVRRHSDRANDGTGSSAVDDEQSSVTAQNAARGLTKLRQEVVRALSLPA